jgi:hypothetical protein
MSLIPFPDVPTFPGVPIIPRSLSIPSLGTIVNAGLLGIKDNIFGPVIWGVYDKTGVLALEPDSFLGIDFKNNSLLSNYPTESGAFATYNKVSTPYDFSVKIALGRDQASRTAMILKLDSMLQSIDLFTVITPEITIKNASLVNYSYNRENKSGVSMITFTLQFMEVRVTATSVFSPVTKVPDSSTKLSNGQVTPSQTTQYGGPFQ